MLLVSASLDLFQISLAMPFGARSGKLEMGASFYNEATAKEFMKMYEKLVQDSWNDDALRKRLIAEPEVVFAERGFDTAEMKEKGYSFKMVERDLTDNKTDAIRIPLPNKPDPSKLTEDQLAAIAGGGSCAGSVGTAGSASCPASTAGSASSAGSHCDKPQHH